MCEKFYCNKYGSSSCNGLCLQVSSITNHDLDFTDFTIESPGARAKRFTEQLNNADNPQDMFTVMAMPDDILEATQSYTITLSSTNANVDSDRASLTINILDINHGTLSIYISIS